MGVVVSSVLMEITEAVLIVAEVFGGLVVLLVILINRGLSKNSNFF